MSLTVHSVEQRIVWEKINRGKTGYFTSCSVHSAWVCLKYCCFERETESKRQERMKEQRRR
jgi:hypothetical protein